MNIKFARMIGRRQQYTPLPAYQLFHDAKHLNRAPLSGMAVTGSNQALGGFLGTLIIDPPAGGFAADDLMGTAPYTALSPTIIAPVAAYPDAWMGPGHYRVCIAANHTSGKFFYFSVAYKTPTGTIYGGTTNNKFVLSSNGATAFLFQITFDLYSPDLWNIAYYCHQARVDADVGIISTVISPVLLLDDTPSSR